MTKKLLMINSRFEPIVGGGETYMMELMDHFSDTGWEVHLVTNNNGRTGDWHEVKVHYIDGFCDKNLHQASICTLRRVLDDVEPDLVHVHNVMPFFAYSSVVSVGEFPAVLTIHDTPKVPERLFGRIGSYKSECAFFRELVTNEKCNKLLMGSRYYLDSYSEALPQIKDDGFSEVAYYFPPLASQGPCTPSERPMDTRKIRILFPSRIVERKGIEDMIYALSMLPEAFALVVPAFASCDDKIYASKIRSLINEFDLNDRLVLPDAPTPPAKMPYYFKQADLVVIPSHYEGFGIAALEAMSWGVPVIASNTGGLSEIITDGFNGLLITPRDIPALKNAIMRIVDDEHLRESLVKNAFDVIESKFSRAKHMAQIERVYRDLL